VILWVSSVLVRGPHQILSWFDERIYGTQREVSFNSGSSWKDYEVAVLEWAYVDILAGPYLAARWGGNGEGDVSKWLGCARKIGCQPRVDNQAFVPEIRKGNPD
jgi:hypothetical protein